ncbi:homoserine kinase [Arsenicicoccus piscis]|uniref:Homoserine kinase n=2 Tax=Arsenicicoccus piscis TaxID=673954 RepID=A0ABQ6HQ45_9MICO|nr:homoserine kinase [Arsenicicoccus piscis]
MAAPGPGPLPEGLAVRVRVPASSANLGPGFDSVGLGLGVYDEYHVTVTGESLVIDVTGEGAEEVPRDGRHLVYRCLALGLTRLGVPVPAGLRLTCRNAVPHGRGMGSSATAAVAGFAAASALVSLAVDGTGEVDLDFCNDLAGEVEGHPDNSSAAVFGGLTVSWSDHPPAVTPVRTVRLDLHPDVVPVVLVPDAQLATATARAVLPGEVPLKDAALGAGRAALLVEAATRRPELLLPATRDWLHQEYRRRAYPTSMALLDTLRERGLAATISGAGPTVLVLAEREHVPSVLDLSLPPGWRALTPGVAEHGATATVLPSV